MRKFPAKSANGDLRNYTGDRLNFTLAAQKVDSVGMAELPNLVMTNSLLLKVAIELVTDPMKMVIFHSYVKLPEGREKSRSCQIRNTFSLFSMSKEFSW